MLHIAFPLLLAAARAASPDVYFEQTTVVLDGGKPAGPGVVSRVWYAGRRMRLEPAQAPGGPALILRLDQAKAYRIDPGRRRAGVVDLETPRARAQMDISVAGDLMGAGEDARVRTAEVGAPRTIAGHACRTFRLTGASTVLDLCMASDLPVGISAFTDFLEWSGASESMAGLIGELRKV